MKAIEFINSLSTFTPNHKNSYLPLLIMSKDEYSALLNTHIDGKHLIHIAAEHGHTRCIMVLVKKYGVSVNKPALTKNQETPLYFACVHGHAETIGHLLILGATIICELDRYTSALEVLVDRNDLNCLNVVLNGKYICSSYSIRKDDPYMFDYPLLSPENRFSKTLAECAHILKFNFQLLGKQGEGSPLTIKKAFEMKNVDMLLYLLTQTKIQNINVIDEYGYTILHHAVSERESLENTAFIALLLQFPDLDIHKKTATQFNLTAMEIAKNYKNKNAVWLLQQKIQASQDVIPELNINSSQTKKITDATLILDNTTTEQIETKLEHHFISLSECINKTLKEFDKIKYYIDGIKTTNHESLFTNDENNNNEDYSALKTIGNFFDLLFEIYDQGSECEHSENALIEKYNSFSPKVKKYLNFFKNLDGQTTLHFMACFGYMKLLKIMLDAIPEHTRASVINTRDNDGYTTLDYAVVYEQEEIIKLLLQEHYIDILSYHSHETTTLSNVIKTKNLRWVKLIVEKMLERGMSLEQCIYQNEYNPLMYAAHLNAIDIVKYFLDKNVSVTLANLEGKMADSLSTDPEIKFVIFHHFFREFSLDEIIIREIYDRLGGLFCLDTLNLEHLTSRGIPIPTAENILSKVKKAISYERLDQANEDKFARPYQKIISPLVGKPEDILKEIAFFLELAKMDNLIEKSDPHYGSNVVNQFFFMLSPQTKIVILASKLLPLLNYNLYSQEIQSFASKGIIDYSFLSLIDCHKNSISYLRSQIDFSFINNDDKDDRTLLLNAIRNEKIKLIKVLLEKGAEINKTDEHGRSGLHMACLWEKTKAALVLIDYHANINQRAKDNMTPLMFAASRNNLVIVKKILSKKNEVEKNVQSTKGYTALHYAIDNNRRESAMYLLQLPDIMVNTVNVKLETPLHSAIKIQDLNIITKLIEQGANLNCKNKNGYTPLMRAAKLNNKQCVVILLHQGANPFLTGCKKKADELSDDIEIKKTIFNHIFVNFHLEESLLEKLYVECGAGGITGLEMLTVDKLTRPEISIDKILANNIISHIQNMLTIKEVKNETPKRKNIENIQSKYNNNNSSSDVKRMKQLAISSTDNRYHQFQPVPETNTSSSSSDTSEDLNKNIQASP